MKRLLTGVLSLCMLNGVVAANAASVPGIISVDDGTVFGPPAYAGMSEYSADEVGEVIDRVWTYYSSNYFTDSWNWTDATFHLGALEAYKATGRQEYYDRTYRYAEGYSWECNYGTPTTYLDDIASSMVYCVLHGLAPADYKLSGVKKALDFTYGHSMLDYSWVDEIYMVGLAQTYLSQATEDPKYSAIDLESYLFYREKFFDPEDMLWYRDAKYLYTSDNPLGQSSNGKKVFWGRGNAWVYVSLAQRMEYMDPSDPAYPIYRNDFLMMSEGIRRAQRADGVWNPNLGDPEDNAGKEMTGTGGFVYGMALGVRLGILDAETYIPVLQRAYETIVNECIFENGFVGYCQPVGWQPDGYTGEESMRDSTNAFGVGLQLMGLSQFMRLCADYEALELNAPVQAFQAENAIYTVDDGWYKGPMVAETSARTETGNGAANLVNGVWTRENVGSRFSAYGLLSSPVTVEVSFAEELRVGKIAVNPYSDRAYQYTLELWNGENWIMVVDTTKESFGMSYLNKFTFEPVTCTALRFTGYGCWSESTDMFSIRELLIYEQ